MHIKITFKDLIDCNPDNNAYPPTLIIRAQKETITIPQSAFKFRPRDGYSIVLNVTECKPFGSHWIIKIQEKQFSPIVIPQSIVAAMHTV